MDLHKLQVVIQANIKDLKKGMAEAKADVKKAVDDMRKESEKAVKPISLKYDSSKTAKIKQDLYKLQGELDRLKAKEEITPKEIGTAKYRQLDEQIGKTVSKLTQLKQREETLNNTPFLSNKQANELENIRNEIQKTIADLQFYRKESDKMLANGSAFEANPAWLSLQDKISAKLDQIRIKQDALRRSQPDGSGYKGFLGMLLRIDGGLKGAMAKFKSANASIKGMLSNFKLLGGNIGNKVTKTLMSVGKAARLMIRRMLIRNTIKSVIQGFKDLYAQGGTTARNMLMLKNSMVGLRGAFASAFAPILNFVAPALKTLINLLTAACNAIARFFAFLTGQPTYTVASAATSGFEEAGGAADGAREKAEKYKKTLLGFDQINKLDEQSDPSSGGGGGGGAGDVTANFKEVATGYSKLADMIKKAWKDDADFTDVGYYVADKLADALEKIPWNKIKENAYKIGKSVATFINGACKNERFWKDLGHTVAEGINTALQLAKGFIQNISPTDVAKAISTAINTAVQDIEWDTLAYDIVVGITKAIKTLVKLIQNIDFLECGKSIIKGIGKGITDAIDEDPENLLGVSVVGTVLLATFTAKVLTLAGKIRTLFQGITKGVEITAPKITGWQVIKATVETVATAVKTAAGNVATGISGIATALGMSVPGLTIFAGAIATVVIAIKGMVDHWGESIQEFKKNDPSGYAKTYGQSLHELSGYADEGKTGFDAFRESLKKISKKWNVKVSLVKEKWKSLKEWIGDKIEVGIKLIKKGWKSLKEWVGTIVNVSIKLLKKGWTTLKKWVGTLVEVGIKLFKKGWTSISKFVGTSVSVGISLFRKGWSTLKSWFGGDQTVGISKTTRTNLSVPSFGTGGFPEDGPFYMNKGEIAGRFSNGKGVVANNQQITEGISRAVFDAMMQAFARGGNRYEVVANPDGIFKVVQKKANDYMQATGQPAFNL